MVKMRICQVIDSLNVGGAERVCIDMCNILDEKGSDFHLLILVSESHLFQELNQSISYTVLNRFNKFSIKKIKQTRDLISKFDIIHCHFRHVYRYIKLVSRIYLLNDIKIILHDHYGSIDVDNKVPKFFNSFLRPKYYIGVSNSLTNWANKNINYVHTYLLRNIIVETNKKINLTKKYDLVLVSNIKPLKNQIFAAHFAEKYNLSILFIKLIEVN